MVKPQPDSSMIEDTKKSSDDVDKSMSVEEGQTSRPLMPDDNKNTVGYKKMEYLNRFYNNDLSMKVNIQDMDNSTLEKIMDTI